MEVKVSDAEKEPFLKTMKAKADAGYASVVSPGSIHVSDDEDDDDDDDDDDGDDDDDDDNSDKDELNAQMQSSTQGINSAESGRNAKYIFIVLHYVFCTHLL